MAAYVSTAWLEERLGDPAVRVIEASIAKETYDAAHIPGARWVDHYADLLRNGDESSGLVLTPEQYAALMERLGVAPETTVVWYGDRHSSYAMRGFWMMELYAHPGGAHVLEGGRERWMQEGRPLTSVETPPLTVTYPVPQTVRDENRATLEQVRAAIGATDKVILDVRARDEYDGSNIRAARTGHIPGGVNIEWTDATAGENILRPEAELREMYERAGVTPDKEVIAHCQLGIRAVHTWFVLKHVLGYPRVRDYDGSWQEWGNRDDTPIER